MRNGCPGCERKITAEELAREGMMHGRRQSDGGPYYTVACPGCHTRLIAEYMSAGDYQMTREEDLPRRSRLARALRGFLGMPARVKGKRLRLPGVGRRSKPTGAFGAADSYRVGGRYAVELETLGLGIDASLEDVRQRHRELAKRYHPDRFARAGEAERDAARQRFIEIHQAYRQIVEGTST